MTRFQSTRSTSLSIHCRHITQAWFRLLVFYIKVQHSNQLYTRSGLLLPTCVVP